MSATSTSSSSGDVGLAIALAEIDGMREFLIMNNSHVANRFNYHLVLISAAFAGSAAIYGTARLAAWAGLVGVVATTVLALGLLTFARIAHADVTREEFITMINLYRAYLLDRAPELTQYNCLPVQLPGEIRRWKVQSALNNLALTLAIINAVIAGAAVVALMLSFIDPEPVWVATLGFSIFAVFFIGQGIWLKRTYARGRANINRIVGVASH